MLILSALALASYSGKASVPESKSTFVKETTILETVQSDRLPANASVGFLPEQTPVKEAAFSAEPTARPAGRVSSKSLAKRPARVFDETPKPKPFALDESIRRLFLQHGIEKPDGNRLLLSPYATGIGIREEDLILAAKVAYFEAGGYATEKAHRAVLSVIYNRCIAPRFGGGLTDIPTEVYRKGQFSVIANKKFRTFEPPETIVAYARDIFQWGNINLPENILFFHADCLGKNWGGRKFYGNIGGNLFFYGRTE